MENNTDFPRRIKFRLSDHFDYFKKMYFLSNLKEQKSKIQKKSNPMCFPK